MFYVIAIIIIIIIDISELWISQQTLFKIKENKDKWNMGTSEDFCFYFCFYVFLSFFCKVKENAGSSVI